MASTFATLLLSAWLLATACAQCTNCTCSTSSPKYCFYYGVPPTKGGNTTVYAYPLSAFSPSVNNAACSCISYVYKNANAAPDRYGCAPGANCTMYSFADANILSSMASLSNYYTNVQSCTTDVCNCNEPGCVDPYTPGACPATGSAGLLKCRIGQIGMYGGVTYSASTPGNLVTKTFPAGSICYKYIYNGLTMYSNLTADSCINNIRIGGREGAFTAASGCNTDLCGAPAPTWASSSASATPPVPVIQVIAVIAAAVSVVAMY